MKNYFALEKRIYLFLAGIIVLVVLASGIAPPRHFPTGTIITVPEGSGLHALAQSLENQGVIRSPFWFRTGATILRGEHNMKAGQYYLESPQSSFVLAWRILRGDHKIKTVKLTIPEGFTVSEISALFDEEFSFFENSLFEMTAPEGYLFPDTYFVPVTATATSTVKLMHDNFIRKIFPVMPEVEVSGRTLEDIIIMASLLEAEVKTKEDKEIASGILWKRLKMGMPLQVDSEMWTYEFAGLPKKPINNPGLVSIEAALHPTTTPYLYFLTDEDGTAHYARTFDEHKTNIDKHLR